MGNQKIDAFAEPAGWTDQVAECFALIDHRDGFDPREYKEMVDRGEARLMRCFVMSEFVGFALIRIESHGTYSEGVVVAAGGRSSENLTAIFLPLFRAYFEKFGCAHMRFHTHREGLARKAEKFGFGVVEYTLRSAINGQ
ncbi:MAG: hypothetical protein ACPGO3_13285 [Magnetospiraceae bacterium]